MLGRVMIMDAAISRCSVARPPAVATRVLSEILQQFYRGAQQVIAVEIGVAAAAIGI